MSRTALRVALAGAGDLGGKCVEALGIAGGWELVGVADLNVRAGEKLASASGIPFCRDHRLMLAQSRPEVLLVATPPGPATELVRLAGAAGVHVVKAAPLARTVEEAAGMVRAQAAAGRQLAVLATRRFNAAYRSLLQAAPTLGRVFLARATQAFNWGGPFGWRGDQASAGGGVLLEAGYEMIDLLIAALGMPEEVYAIAGRQGRPHMVAAGGDVEPLGVYDTDDTAVVTLRYPGGTMAVVTVSWAVAPAVELVSLHGQAGSAEARPGECLLRDRDGKVIQRVPGDDRPVPALAEQLRCLATSLAAPARRGRPAPRAGAERAGEARGPADSASSGEAPSPPGPPGAREHLLTMAVVEAAYLSNRTGQAENPQRLLQTHGFSVAECLGTPPTPGA